LLTDSSLTIGTFLRRELAPIITEVMTDTENSSDFSTFLSLVSVGNSSGSSGSVFYDWTIRVRILSGARDFSLVQDVQVRMGGTVPLPSWRVQGTTVPGIFAFRSQASEHCFPSDDM